MTSLKRFKTNPDVVGCDISGDVALLHMKKNIYFTMNPTAVVVWEAMSEPRSLEDLVQAVTEKFDVPEELCRKDVEALVSHMVTADIVSEVVV